MVMRVFVAGGTGVLGRRLVPQLVTRGHQVTATTTSVAKLDLLERLGATGVVMDGLDAASVGEAVAKARPSGNCRLRTSSTWSSVAPGPQWSTATGRNCWPWSREHILNIQCRSAAE